jgi:hypothetical protein
VVSVELPSVAQWDMIHTQREQELRALGAWQGAATGGEVNHNHLDGPFLFCHRLLRSRVKRCYSRVYDLTPEKLGVEGFDLVFVGDVLGHLFSPLQALDVLAALCRGKMILALNVYEDLSDVPAMQYIGETACPEKSRSWWVPNRRCLERMLRHVGFSRVEFHGPHDPIIRRLWVRQQGRFLIHAAK